MFVVYHKETTKLLRVFRKGYWQNAVYKSKGACTAALNRAVKKSKVATAAAIRRDNTRRAAALADQVHAKNYAILPLEEFKKIEKTEIRHGIAGAKGTEFVVSVNEDWTSGPWSETYWSA